MNNSKRLKIFLLGDLNSPHFTKWVKGFLNYNFEIHVFTFGKKQDDLPGVNIYYGGSEYNFLNFEKEGSLKKLLLYTSLPKLFLLLKRIKPDILHSHYASSYGLFGTLLFYHPYIVSVWGSDIFSFPGKSFFHLSLIKFVLRKADVILATSKALAEETKKYTSKKIHITPFGIDIKKFRKINVESDFGKDSIVIGTIKSLEKIYGIDILLRVFAKLKEYNKNIKLFIAGEGNQETELKELSKELGISNDIIFAGRIPYDTIEVAHNRISIFANLSLAESFGVAVLEAGACEVPVIASDCGGLREVVQNNVTGYTVNISNKEEIIKVFQSLIDNETLRREMGKAAREMVIESFNWDKNLMDMINIYDKTFQDRYSNTRS